MSLPSLRSCFLGQCTLRIRTRGTAACSFDVGSGSFVGRPGGSFGGGGAVVEMGGGAGAVVEMGGGAGAVVEMGGGAGAVVAMGGGASAVVETGANDAETMRGGEG